MSRERIVEELHRVARRSYPRRKVEIRAIDETWQGDLVDMQKYSEFNKGYTFLLTMIDVVSKFAWTVPLKNKTGLEVKKALEKIFEKGRIPEKLQCDQGKEFYNSEVKSLEEHKVKLLEKHKIHLYSSFSNLKASIIERFNRTLKTNMWKLFTLNGNYNWLDILDDLTLKYNNTVHRSIGMRPTEVSWVNEREVIDKLQKQKYYNISKYRKNLKVGDIVRISKLKHVFEKGYTPNWTSELFTIKKVMKTVPVTYLLKDLKNVDINGCFYQEELQKTRCPDEYLIEEVLDRRGDKIKVKWFGFPEKDNQWVHKNALL